MSGLTAERLREVLKYDSATGVFTWIVPKQSIRIGDVAGRVNKAGYRGIKIDGARYYAHRLAWVYVYGEWPEAYIDHVNTDRDDNRIGNLRAATRSENGCNRGLPVNNTSGVKGVCWNKRYRKWVAMIKLHGRRKHLGYYHSLDDAAHAYAAAASKLHGEFARI